VTPNLGYNPGKGAKMKKLLVVLLWVLGIAAAIHFTDKYTQIEENIMAIAKSTLDFITKEEGARNKAYKDSKGLWTIGVGHLIKDDEKDLITANLTNDRVEDLLRKDLKWCSEAVESSVKVPLAQNQFDALYSLCFNIGSTAFKNSTVVKRINANDLKGAADAILMWNKPAVLEGRRKRERELFLANI
jgi:lysozyme